MSDPDRTIPERQGAYICHLCGTNLYNTCTGWVHYSTGSQHCYDEVEVDEQQARLLGMTW